MAKTKKAEEATKRINKVIELANAMIEVGNELLTLIGEPKEEPKEAVKEEKPQPTLEEVREVLADLSRRGYTSNVRLMIIGFGVSKLSEVDPKDYAELLAKAKELNDATKD